MKENELWHMNCYGDEELTTVGEIVNFVAKRLQNFGITKEMLVSHCFGLIILPAERSRPLSWIRDDLEVGD